MVIVTGANGFIGSQMVSLLLEKGRGPVVAVDPVSPLERSAPLRGLNVQFLDRDAIWAFLELPQTRSEVSWIIHMGANSSTTETNWDHLVENNIQYSQKLWDWCTRNGKSYIYASSAATYGNGDQGYDDATPAEKLKALNLYGRSKLEFDQWVRQQKEAPLHWYGLKFFNVYGPQETHKGPQASVAMKAYHQILKDGSLKLFKSDRAEYKDGEQKRDFIYVKDICSWILELMEKTPASDIYNMGTGQARSWVDLAHAVFAALDRPPKIEFIDMPKELKGQYQYFTEARMDKWTSRGLSKPKFSLEDGVRDYVRNFLMKETDLTR